MGGRDWVTNNRNSCLLENCLDDALIPKARTLGSNKSLDLDLTHPWR